MTLHICYIETLFSFQWSTCSLPCDNSIYITDEVDIRQDFLLPIFEERFLNNLAVIDNVL